jgi:hypothetical protein
MTPAPSHSGFGEAPALAEHRTVPFEYAFRYELTGRPGNVLNRTVTVSIEATFVAVSIGYGVIPKVTALTFGPQPSVPILLLKGDDGQPALRDVTIGVILDALDTKLPESSRMLKRETGAEAALKNGIKLNPDIAELALQDGGNGPLDASLLQKLFQVVGAPPENIQFLYALFDEASGREFQNEPILNIAGLGISNGDRPFRYFSTPIVFAPQATIRLEIREVSDFEGELHVALHGYKVLGARGTPTGRVQQRVGRIRRR